MDTQGGANMYCESSACCDESSGRRFLTTDEKVDKLQEYKAWLEHEAKGVEEAIQKMKKAK